MTKAGADVAGLILSCIGSPLQGCRGCCLCDYFEKIYLSMP